MFRARVRGYCASLVVLLTLGGASAASGPSRLPGVGTWSVTTDAVPAASSTDEQESAKRDFGQLRREIAQRIATLAAQESTTDASAGNTERRQLITFYRFLDSIFAQQEIVAGRELEFRQAIDESSQRLKQVEALGWEAVQVHSFAQLEQLRDERDDARFHAELIAQEIHVTQSTLVTSREQVVEIQRLRRQITEKLTKLDDPTSVASLRQKLRQAELRERVTREVSELRAAELQLKKLELDWSKLQQKLLEHSVQVAERGVPFTQADLDWQLAELEKSRLRLEQQSLTHQQSLEQFEQASRSSSLDELHQDDWHAEPREMIRHALHGVTELTSRSQATVALMQHGWQVRYRVLNEQVSQDDTRMMRSEVEKFIQQTRESQAVLEARIAETRLDVELMTRSAAAGQAPEATETKPALSVRDEGTASTPDGVTQSPPANDIPVAVQQWFEVANQRQLLLRHSEQLFRRVLDEMNQRLGDSDSAARFAQVWPWMKAWAGYELIAVDDRPITIGKLTGALVLLLCGLFLARQLSRLVGNRLLPRLGLYQGASSAVQTITFYSLVLLFGFFTLELLSIPITVLTFFGGAAAIAIGFGSQNLLNNFISGLIILGEQPIRVGDLIEVDGLHGTVEHIGGRSTRVRTGTNREIIIPNSKFLENNVTNLTLSSTRTRTLVKVGVAYGSSVDQVIVLLQQAVADVSQVLRHPDPIVLLTDFGDNALQFEIHFWVNMRTQMDSDLVESEVRRQVDRLFREHHISIAFPQCDVHLDLTSPVDLRIPQTRQASRRVA
ncbi:MAG: mechanosensitive ion channel [Planctomycetales bacterium]|nr:mechanosensitive ion channel [Planctomycetales bacterium]